jgi:hypothetical protein
MVSAIGASYPASMSQRLVVSMPAPVSATVPSTLAARLLPCGVVRRSLHEASEREAVHHRSDMRKDMVEVPLERRIDSDLGIRGIGGKPCELLNRNGTSSGVEHGEKRHGVLVDEALHLMRSPTHRESPQRESSSVTHDVDDVVEGTDWICGEQLALRCGLEAYS